MTLELDICAAKRQSIGSMFTATNRDAKLVEELFEGRLTLPPHPTWELPATIDWSANPFNDRNWLHQFPMLRWMDPLRRAAENGNRRAGEMWIKHARSWYEANPPGNSAAPLGWKDMVDGVRAIALAIAVPFVADEYPQELDWLTSSLKDHVEWLQNADNLGHSNHALNQHMGLFVTSSVLRDEKNKRLAATRLNELFLQNYDSEGVNAEGAIIYHLLNYRWWNEAKVRLELESTEVPEGMQLLELAPEALAHATKPDGNFVNIGDTDTGGPTGVNHPFTKYVTSKGSEGEPPPDLAKNYQSGYIFGRSGWGEHERTLAEETFYSISYGKANRVHGHPDGMSLTYSADGVEWLRDPGKYQYGSSPMRKYCFDRDSHNVPYVPGAKYNTTTIVPCTKSLIGRGFHEYAFTDTGYAGTDIKRRVIYSTAGEYLIVIDSVRNAKEQTVVQNWQFGPQVTASIKKRRIDLISGQRRAALIFAGSAPEVTVEKASDDPIGGWIATGWKTRAAAPRALLRKTGKRFRFVTALVPGLKGMQPEVATLHGARDGALCLSISNGHYTESIAIFDDRVELLSRAGEQRAEDFPSIVPHGASAEARVGILSAISTTRKLAHQQPAEKNTQKLAIALEQEYAEFVGSADDLGLRACLADLRYSVGKTGNGAPERAGIVDWADSGSLHHARDQTPIRSYASVDAEVNSFTSEVLLSFTAGPFAIPARFSPGQGSVLTVLLHGALDRTRIELPMFQRHRFHTSLNLGPTLSIADPTLDLSSDLRLAWYLGNEGVDLHNAIGQVVNGLSLAHGFERVLLIGGSGGGFAALQIGTHVPQSAVIAMNPQTDLRRYSPRWTEAALSAAFGILDIEEQPELLRRVSVISNYEQSASLPQVHMIANMGDRVHLNKHVKPFANRFLESGAVAGSLVNVHLGAGHRSPTNEQYAKIITPIYDQL